MNGVTHTSAFKSGNSIAIRVPKVFGVQPGDRFELVRKPGHFELRPVEDIAKEKAELSELCRILIELGQRKDPVLREPIEVPDRQGLY